MKLIQFESISGKRVIVPVESLGLIMSLDSGQGYAVHLIVGVEGGSLNVTSDVRDDIVRQWACSS